MPEQMFTCNDESAVEQALLPTYVEEQLGEGLEE